MVVTPHPADPLARFGELHRALFEKRRWFERDHAVRYAALQLVLVDGPATVVARRVEERAQELHRGLRWYHALRGSLRFAVAATLVREELSVRELLAAFAAADPLFRRHWRLRGDTWEQLAVLVLLVQDPERRVRAAAVDRLAAIWKRLRIDHPVLTQRSDWPACACLVARPEGVEELGRRLEDAYRGLRAEGLVRGDALQRAAQLLVLGEQATPEGYRRVGLLLRAFREAGLWMHGGDYDELALLAVLDVPAGAVVERVLAHRATLAALRPAPGREMSFSLACGTALIELRSAHGGADGRLEALAGLVSLLLAHQAAVAAAAAGGAAVAAS